MKTMLKTLMITTLLFFGAQAQAGTNASYTKASNILQTLQEIRTLASDYALTNDQKTQIRIMIMTAAPEGQRLGHELLNNRFEILELTAGKSEYDSDAVAEIAARQGGIITELIIWKESLKAEIRTVLDEDQMAFVEELVQLIIQQRIQEVTL